MPGANYMGGRRNAAKARLKDVTGRAQKGHFVKQRHQILVQGLQGEDGGFTTRSKRKAEDIELAHAQRDLRHSKAAKTKSLANATIFRDRMRNSLVPTTSSSDYEPNLRSSKVLEKLDINDPYSLRATMDRLLKIPDFAGLSTSVKRRPPEAVSQDQPMKRQLQKIKPSSPSPLPPSSPQTSISIPSSLPVSVKTLPSKLAGDRDSSSTRQLPIAEDDSIYPEDDSEDYRNELQSSLEHDAHDDNLDENMHTGFSELRGSSLPVYRSSLSDRSIRIEDDDISDFDLTPVSEFAYGDSLDFRSSRRHQEREQDPKSQLDQLDSQDSFSLVLDFPNSPNEGAYSQPIEVEYVQDAQDDQPLPRKELSLLEVDQPWLALDEFLGLNSTSTIQNDIDPFEFLTDIGRRGLGYESPQKTVTASKRENFPSGSHMEIDPQTDLALPLEFSHNPTKQLTRDYAHSYRSQPSLKSFISRIPPRVESNVPVLPSSSSPSSKATSTSGSAGLLKTPSTGNSTSRFEPTIAVEPPRRVANTTSPTWISTSIPQALVDPLAPSIDDGVSDSLYQHYQTLCGNNTKTLDYKLAHLPSLTERQQPMELDTRKVEAHSTLANGPSLFADDDDDY